MVVIKTGFGVLAAPLFAPAVDQIHCAWPSGKFLPGPPADHGDTLEALPNSMDPVASGNLVMSGMDMWMWVCMRDAHCAYIRGRAPHYVSVLAHDVMGINIMVYISMSQAYHQSVAWF